MTNNTRTVIASIVVTMVALAGLTFLGKWWDRQRTMEFTEVDTILAESLREYIARDESILSGIISLKETGSAFSPRELLLTRPDLDEEIWSDRYEIRATVLPEGLMQTATLTYFIDRKYIDPEDMVPIFEGDSISIREGFLMSSREVADWMVTGSDTRLYDASTLFNERFDDYFGSSESCYIPKAQYRLKETAASIADGYGLLLSQEQILTFFDSIANGGVRARHRYFRKRRICREETARQMTELLRENVTDGTGTALSGHSLQIAGKTGVGMLEFGYVPGKGRVNKQDSVTVASFAGFFPADSPKYTMCVTLYSETPGYQPSEVAMEIFGKVAKRIHENQGVWKR